MRNKFIIIFIALVLVITTVYGQDFNFTQFHTNLLEVNPAYAGSALQPRMSINYRNQWPGINNAFVTYSASYDQMHKPFHGAVGFKISNDVQGAGTLNFLSVDAIYSYQAKITNKLFIAAAIQAGYAQNNLRWSELKFSDMIDPIQGFVNSTSETSSDNMVTRYPDFASGVSAYFKKHYIGFSVHHLTKPSISFLSKNSSRLDRKYTVNYGYTIPIHINGWVRPRYFISPSIMFQKQGDFEQIIYGTYVNSRPLTYGFWIRQSLDIIPNSLVFLLGYKKDNIKVSYTYDLSISKLFGSTYGTHEVSFIMLFRSKEDINNKDRAVFSSPWF